MSRYFVFKERCWALGPAVFCSERLNERNPWLLYIYYLLIHMCECSKNIIIISLAFLKVYVLLSLKTKIKTWDYYDFMHVVPSTSSSPLVWPPFVQAWYIPMSSSVASWMISVCFFPSFLKRYFESLSLWISWSSKNLEINIKQIFLKSCH